MNEERRRLLGISEAADFLGVHQNTLRAWANKGLVPYVRTPTGYRRFDPADLEKMQVRVEAENVGKLAA